MVFIRSSIVLIEVVVVVAVAVVIAFVVSRGNWKPKKVHLTSGCRKRQIFFYVTQSIEREVDSGNILEHCVPRLAGNKANLRSCFVAAEAATHAAAITLNQIGTHKLFK